MALSLPDIETDHGTMRQYAPSATIRKVAERMAVDQYRADFRRLGRVVSSDWDGRGYLVLVAPFPMVRARGSRSIHIYGQRVG